jgi:hypothetical protein
MQVMTGLCERPARLLVGQVTRICEKYATALRPSVVVEIRSKNVVIALLEESTAQKCS